MHRTYQQTVEAKKGTFPMQSHDQAISMHHKCQVCLNTEYGIC